MGVVFVEEGPLRGIEMMNRCLPGRQGRRNRERHSNLKKQHERRHRGRKLHVFGCRGLYLFWKYC